MGECRSRGMGGYLVVQDPEYNTTIGMLKLLQINRFMSIYKNIVINYSLTGV